MSYDESNCTQSSVSLRHDETSLKQTGVTSGQFIGLPQFKVLDNTWKSIQDAKQGVNSTHVKLLKSYKKYPHIPEINACHSTDPVPSTSSPFSIKVPEGVRASWVSRSPAYGPAEDFSKTSSERVLNSDTPTHQDVVTPTFQFVDAMMPVVPPTPADARRLASMSSSQLPASWVSVRPSQAPIAAAQSFLELVEEFQSQGRRNNEKNGLPLFRIENMEVTSEKVSSVDPPVDALNTQADKSLPLIRKSMKLVEEPIFRKSMRLVSNFDKPEIEDSDNVVKTADAEPYGTDGDLIESHSEIQVQEEDSPPVIRKRAYLAPEAVLPGYPGFSDVRDLDKKGQSMWKPPKWDPSKRRKTQEKSEKQIKQTVEVENKYGARIKHTITPSSWRAEQTLLKERLKALGKEENVTTSNEMIDKKEDENKIEKKEDEKKIEINPVSCQENTKKKKDEKKIEINPVFYQKNSKKITRTEGSAKHEKKSGAYNIPKHTVVPAKTDTKLPAKVRHYDAEAARLFIEKQKLKRKQTATEAMNKNKHEQELKRQHLKELNDKAVKLAEASVKAKKAQTQTNVKSNLLNIPNIGQAKCEDSKISDRSSNPPNLIPTRKTSNEGSSNPPNLIPTRKTSNEGSLNPPNLIPTRKTSNDGSSNPPNLIPTRKTSNDGSSNPPNLIPTRKTSNDGSSNPPNLIPTRKTSNDGSSNPPNLIPTRKTSKEGCAVTENLLEEKVTNLEQSSLPQILIPNVHLSEVKLESYTFEVDTLTEKKLKKMVESLKQELEETSKLYKQKHSEKRLRAISSASFATPEKLKTALQAEVQKLDSNIEKLRNIKMLPSHQIIDKSETSSQDPALRPAANDFNFSHLLNSRNITARTTQLQMPDLDNIGNLSTSIKEIQNSRRKISAATKIQAIFRGYLHRKSYKSLLDSSTQKYELSTELDSKSELDISQGPLDESAPGQYPQIPSFPEIKLTHSPSFNFISAVKKKLQSLEISEQPPVLIQTDTHDLQPDKNNSVSLPKKSTNINLSDTREKEESVNKSVDINIKPNTTSSSSPEFRPIEVDLSSSSDIASKPSRATVSEEALGIDIQQEGTTATHHKLVSPRVTLESRPNVLRSLSEHTTSIFRHPPREDSTRRHPHRKIQKINSHLNVGNSQSTTRLSSQGVKTKLPKRPTSAPVSSSSSDQQSSEKHRTDREVGDTHSYKHHRHADFTTRESLSFERFSTSSVLEPVLLPSALQLQFQAELNLLDSVEQSQQQLLEVENMRALSLTKQTTSSLAEALTSAIVQHKQEVERNAEKNDRFNVEKQELKKYFEEALKNHTLKVKKNRMVSPLSSKEESLKDEVQLDNQASLIPCRASLATEEIESNSYSFQENMNDLQSVNASISEHIVDVSGSESMSEKAVSSVGGVSSLGITQKMQQYFPDIDLSTLKSSSDLEDFPLNESVTDYESVQLAKLAHYMITQLIKQEDERVQNQKALLKARDEVATERTKSQLAFLEIQKKALREKGMERGISTIRKKQRSLILKLQQLKEQIAKLKENHKQHSKERKQMLLRHKHLLKMRMDSGTEGLKKGSESQSVKLISHSRQSSQSQADQLSSASIPEQLGSSELHSSIATDVASKSDGNKKKECVIVTEDVILECMNKLEKNKSILNEQAKALLLRRQSLEEVIRQRKQLEAEEEQMQELESQALNYAKTLRKPRDKIVQFRDSSTSPLLVPSIEEETNEQVTASADDIKTTATSSSIPTQISESIQSKVPMVDKSTSPSGMLDPYENESFELIESSENSNPEMKSTCFSQDGTFISNQEFSNQKRKKTPIITIKAPLSPMVPGKPRRRHSSGSDDSVIFSQNDTASEQSDAEGRVSALNEQLHKRMVEANRLRREQKRMRSERLKCKEQALLKQIQAYDKIIAKTKLDLEKEKEMQLASNTTIVRPMIKQPRVAEKRRLEENNKSAPGVQDQKPDLLGTHVEGSTISEHTDIVQPNEISVSPKQVDNKLEHDSVIQSFVDVSKSSVIKELSLPSKSVDEDIPEELEVTDKSSNDASSIVSENLDETVSEERHSLNQSFESGSVKSISQGSSVETTIQSLLQLSKVENMAGESDIQTKIEEKNSSLKDVDNTTKMSAESENAISVNEQKLSIQDHENINSAEISEKIVEELDYTSEFESSNNVKTSFHDSDQISLGEEIIHDIPVVDNQENETGNVSIVSEGPLDESFEQENASRKLVDEEHLGQLSKEELKDCTFIVEKEISHERNNILADEISNYIMVQLIKDLTFPQVKHVGTRDESSVEIKELKSIVSEEQQDEELIESAGKVDTSDILANKKADNDMFSGDLLDECLSKKEEIIDTLFEESLQEALDHVLQINADKRCGESETNLQLPQSKVHVEDSSVIRRVHEILAETVSSLSSVKERTRPQDLMITTYDVLPPDEEAALAKLPVSPGNESYHSDHLDAPPTSPVEAKEDWKKVDFGVSLVSAGDAENTDHEGFSQEWFDEDFGLSHTSREAEELRLQQMQIEQEIQQLQQAQEHIPYFYIREIPNKPPPPYTPPGHGPLRPRARVSQQTVPASRPEVTAFALAASDTLYDVVAGGGDLDLVRPQAEVFGGDVEESRHVYKTFLFDLTKEIVMDIYEWETKEWRPLWDKPTCPSKRRKLLPRSKEMLREIVQKQVLNVFGFVQKPTKENMIMSWSRKKRDYVDDLLMREAHEEEEGWTNYDEDEVTLKNEIAISILNNILDETVHIFQDIHNAQIKKQ